MRKRRILYCTCEKCGMQFFSSHEATVIQNGLFHEAACYGLALSEYYEWEQLEKDVAKAAYDVSVRKNAYTDAAYDAAVKKLCDFLAVHNLVGVPAPTSFK